MARPKGSKNKTKEEPAHEPADFRPPFTEAWTSPTHGYELEDGETPKARSTGKEPPCATCKDGAEHHYGSDKRWCNRQHCRCVEYRP